MDSNQNFRHHKCTQSRTDLTRNKGTRRRTELHTMEATSDNNKQLNKQQGIAQSKFDATKEQRYGQICDTRNTKYWIDYETQQATSAPISDQTHV